MLKIDKEFKQLIPPLMTEEFEQLEKNILVEGIREPLIAWYVNVCDCKQEIIECYATTEKCSICGTEKEYEYILIDGHNRYEIAEKYNLEYEVKYKDFKDRDEVIEWMILNQFGRRNLSNYQRSLLTLKLKPVYEEKAKERMLSGKKTDPSQISEQGKTSKELAKIAGVSHDTIAKVQKIEEKATEEVKKKIETGELSINKAYNDIKQKEKREEIKKNIEETPKEQSKSIDIYNPPNKYRVIYSDPPWSYGNTMPEYFTEQADHYTLMTLKQICELPVKELAEDNAVLFLWVTSPILEESFEVVKAWGFKYKSTFIWDKVKHNMGHYNSVRHEILLVCTKGSCQPDVKKLFDSVQSIERTEHSAKPKEFIEIINTIYPIGKRLEMFARKETEGWDIYGNEI